MENEANQEAQKEAVAFRVLISSDGLRLDGPLLSDELGFYGVWEKVKQMVQEMHKPKIVKPNGFKLTRGH